MNPPEPLISVVIPTLNRPHLVLGAVASALRQSLREIEVIVVIDGPDEETLRALRPIADPRLRLLPLPANVGLGGARQAGIDAARAPWVAPLDDDDEWLPQKLALQREAAQCSHYRAPIITCRVIARRPQGDVVRPRRPLALGEELSEYLFCNTGPLDAAGLVLPSTILAPRDLLRAVRFRYRRGPFEGSDWLLRAIQHDGAGVEFVATSDPLVLWRDDARARMSNTADWAASLAWADSQTALLTPRARAGFILNRVSRQARQAGNARAFWLLLRAAFRGGRPTPNDVLAHALVWLLPRQVRATLVALEARWRRPLHARRR